MINSKGPRSEILSNRKTRTSFVCKRLNCRWCRKLSIDRFLVGDMPKEFVYRHMGHQEELFSHERNPCLNAMGEY
jgi:hypothetical protein